jgi:hypothetical protein
VGSFTLHSVRKSLGSKILCFGGVFFFRQSSAVCRSWSQIFFGLFLCFWRCCLVREVQVFCCVVQRLICPVFFLCAISLELRPNQVFSFLI